MAAGMVCRRWLGSAAFAVILCVPAIAGEPLTPGDAEAREQALMRCFALRRSEPAAAIGVAETLLQAPAAPDFEIKALSCLGMAAGIAGDSARAIAAAERIEALLDAHPQPDDFMLRALSNAGAIFHNAGQIARAEALYHRAYAAALKEDEAVAQASMLVNIALIHAEYLDDVEAAGHFLDQALALDLPPDHDATLLHYNHASNLIRQGRDTDALRALERAAASARRADNRLVRYRVQALRAGVLAQMGLHGESLALLDEAIAQQQSLPDPAGEAISLVRLSALQRATGQNRRALASAEQARARADGDAFRGERLEALAAVSAAHAALGNAAAALQAAEQRHELKQSLLKQYDREALASLQARLQDASSRGEIERLRHESEIAALKRQSERLRRNALNAGLIVLVLAGAVVAVLQRRLNRRLKRLSATDPLTGLMNRRAAMERMNARTTTVAGAARDVLFLIDIDRFKQINDRHGHDAGDRVLTAIAARLRHACRPGDAIARWGGEEFVMLCGGLTPEQAGLLAERLRLSVASEPVCLPDGVRIDLTVSVGFAPYPFFAVTNTAVDETGSWRDAVRLADRALYAVKHSGRDAWAGLWGARTVRSRQSLQAALRDPQDAVRRGAINVISNRTLDWRSPMQVSAEDAVAV
jgi:diguanylate cyclase (GGDEF)-like protein